MIRNTYVFITEIETTISLVQYKYGGQYKHMVFATLSACEKL